MASKIESMIDELQQFIEVEGKPTAFKPDCITINRDELDSYVDDLRANIPAEIRQYQKIINNKEAILADAQRKADAIIAEAQIQTNELVSEHQIMQQAYAQANEVVLIASKQAEEMLDKATCDANDIRMGAMEYTDGLLRSVQDILAASIDTTRSRMESYLDQMQGYYDIVCANRNELQSQPEVTENVNNVSVNQTSKQQSAPVVEQVEVKQTTENKAPEQTLDVPDAFFNKD